MTGAEIRAGRLGLRLTQAELAERIGYSRKAVETWEIGHRHPRPHAARQLMAVFGVCTCTCHSRARGEPSAITDPGIRERAQRRSGGSGWSDDRLPT